MLTDDIKQEIRGSLAKIAGVMPALKARPGQRLMIAEVARAFAACSQGKSDKDKARLPRQRSSSHIGNESIAVNRPSSLE